MRAGRPKHPKASDSHPGIPRDVLPGKDGWLFLVGNARMMARLYRRDVRTFLLLRRWTRLIRTRRRKAAALGVRYLQFIVPDKLSIYADKLDAPFPSPLGSPARRLGLSLNARERSENWVPTFEAFTTARRDGQVYYRTDTHWTTRGYLVAYRLICAAVGVSPAVHVEAGRIVHVRAFLDTGIKCDPPVDEQSEYFVFDTRSRRVAENALVTFREANPAYAAAAAEGSVIVTRSDHHDAAASTVVVFGDSHAFHPTGLGLMLGETFGEVHLVWSAEIDWGYVARVRPNLLVQQLSERSLILPTPGDGLHVETFAAARLAAVQAAAASDRASSLP